MRSKYAWLLLPPVLALIVFLGPLQDLNNGPSAPAPVDNTKTGTETGTGTGTGTRRPQVGAQVPQLPGFWQISSTLVGVLLLGVVFLGLMRKLRENSRATSASPLVLRQSLRLSARHHVHALQYEDRILVLGACDHSISVLCTGEDPGVAGDEAAIRKRERQEQEDEDDGAVPRDMILPRPEEPRRKLAQAEESEQKLADFRALLKRTRVKAEV